MKRSLLFLSCLFIIAFSSAQVGDNSGTQKKNPPVAFFKTASKLHPDLRGLYEKYNPSPQDKSAPVSSLPLTEATQKMMQIKGDRVLVDFTVQENTDAVKQALQQKGIVITGSYGRMISASVPIRALPQIESIAGVRFAMPAYKPYQRPRATDLPSSLQKGASLRPGFLKAPVISQGDTAQLSFLARKKYKVNGDGVKVGILSDSYNNLGGAQQGVIHNELPGYLNPAGFRKPVQVIEDLDSGGIDEGRGMAEIVHDVAPGSSMAFHTAFLGQADFAQGIQDLADNGCQIVCDDVYYYAEPFFQDGIIAQSVDQVRSRGVTYFSAAGNQGDYSYESNYRPSDSMLFGPGYGTAHNFSAPGDKPRYFQPVVIPPGYSAIFSFQWDDPFFSAGGAAAASDYDIYLTDKKGNIVAGSALDNLALGDPIEVFGYYNDLAADTFYVSILKYAGPDAHRLKYILFNAGYFPTSDPPVPGIYSPTLYGHPKAEGAVSMGAAYYFSTPPYGVNPAQVNYYSSLGGIPNLFDTQGNRIKPVVRRKPDIVGPDGGNTSFFYPGGDITIDSDTFPNFFGTSAATPHAAGVAALMIEASKSHGISNDQIQRILYSTAQDMDNIYTNGFDRGYDLNTGYGFINALKAVGRADSLCDGTADKITASVLPKADAAEGNTASVYPNPFAQSFRVYLSLVENKVVQIELFGADGKRLLIKTTYQSKGTIDIDAKNYQPGLYVLKVRQGDFLKTIKLVKE